MNIIIILAIHYLILQTWECVSTYNLQNYVSSNQQIEGKVLQLFSTDIFGTILGVQLSDGKQSKVNHISHTSSRFSFCFKTLTTFKEEAWGSANVKFLYTLGKLLLIASSSSKM